MRDFKGKSVNANYIGNMTYIGKIWFYEDAYEFKAESVNSQISMGKILYRDIKAVVAANTLGIIPNSLIVELHDGRRFQYVVIKRKEVMLFLCAQIAREKGER